MKKTLSFTLGCLAYLVLALLFSSYGHKEAHPGFNETMVNHFLDNLTGDQAIEKFENYSFDLHDSGPFTGKAVTNEGYISASVTEADREMTPVEWIRHGGFSADEPELPAAVRHFYDPTQPEGQRYLQDRAFNLVDLPFNPEIDHIEWSTTHVEHPYNWEQAKYHVYKALTDPESKDKSMAFAYRALGETLHMIADLGCPAHVRDDEHAGSLLIPNWIHLGSPDAYEELFNTMTDNIESWSKGRVDQSLELAFAQAPTVVNVAQALAIYSNEHFFTDQTISGEDVVPKTHPEKTYASPKLEQCQYDPFGCLYTQNISGHLVKQCRDKSFLWGRDYPYIDLECATSQAIALVPQIVEAGAQTIRLFFPALEVKITDFSGTRIKGMVVHKIDAEYPNQIKYNGPVGIFKEGHEEIFTTINCFLGEFDEDISLAGAISQEDQIYAQIEFGGVKVRSTGIADDTKFVSLGFALDLDILLDRYNPEGIFVETYSYGSDPEVPYFGSPYFNFSMDGNAINQTWKFTTAAGVEYDGNIAVFLSDDRQTVLSYDFKQTITVVRDDADKGTKTEFIANCGSAWLPFSVDRLDEVEYGYRQSNPAILDNIDELKINHFKPDGSTSKLNSYKLMENTGSILVVILHKEK